MGDAKDIASWAITTKRALPHPAQYVTSLLHLIECAHGLPWPGDMTFPLEWTLWEAKFTIKGVPQE